MDRMKYGYACVSTEDQNPALQLAALKKAGCQTVFTDEGLSGATTKRPALLRCLKKLEDGQEKVKGDTPEELAPLICCSPGVFIIVAEPRLPQVCATRAQTTV